MLFSDRILLRTVTNSIVNGFATESATETEVWADQKSVGRSEFYQSAQAGMRADIIFAVHTSDYAGQTEIKYESNIYDVTRTYQKGLDVVELTCVRRE